jgi:steroid delta-isomerase-like uncharacterized protein
MTAGEEARAVVARYLAALNRHDANAAADCVTVDFFNEHTSAIGTSVRGRNAYRERLPQFLDRFHDLRYEVEDVIGDGDRVAVPYTMTCSVQDDQSGEECPVRIRGMFRFRVEGGLIAHRVDYWDGHEFERQVATVRRS